MKRAPMKSRGFAARRAAAPAEKELNREQRLALRAKRAMESGARLRAAASAEKGQGAQAPRAPAAIKSIVPRPKPQHHQNRRLLDLAERMPCLLRIPGTCNRDPSTTVAAHSNSSIHGKAGTRKADDQYSVWACATCHHWLDFGTSPRATKDMAFMRAHADQVLLWRHIAQDTRRPDADRRAAQWALSLLNATPAQAGCGPDAINFELESQA